MYSTSNSLLFTPIKNGGGGGGDGKFALPAVFFNRAQKPLSVANDRHKFIFLVAMFFLSILDFPYNF